MSSSTPKPGSADWYLCLEKLPSPLVHPLEIFASALGNELLRWAACRDFCVFSLSLLHTLALAARAGVESYRPSNARFPHFQRQTEWIGPCSILHAWAEINPALPKAARLPMTRTATFPELHPYADERGLARPTHAVEALNLLRSLAEDIATAQLDLSATKESSATLDTLLARLAFRELHFLTRWTLAVRLSLADDALEATLHHALILRGPAPRCRDMPAAMRSAPATRVVALPDDKAPALNLYPFCLFDALPAPTTVAGGHSDAAKYWPTLKVLIRSTGVPLYRCAASGALAARPDLARSVADACSGKRVLLSGNSARWGLLWIGIRKMRDLNKACAYGKADRILLAMDRAAAQWSTGSGASDNEDPIAFPFWRHADELAIPFRYAAGTDPFAAVRSAAAQVVAAAVSEALACGIGIPWPACEADQNTHTPSAGPLKISIGFTLDVGVESHSHEPFSQRMAAELAHIRSTVGGHAKKHSTRSPLLWVGRQNTNAEWRVMETQLFARVSEAAFVIARNAAKPTDWLLRRNRHRGLFNLVGGHLEAMDGNDGDALIRREIHEELGVNSKPSDLRQLTVDPVMVTEYSDRARCMTLYAAHFFEMILSPEHFDEAACRAHNCRWEPAERIVAAAGIPSANSDIARFPARLLSTTSDGACELRYTNSPADWAALSTSVKSSGCIEASRNDNVNMEKA